MYRSVITHDVLPSEFEAKGMLKNISSWVIFLLQHVVTSMTQTWYSLCDFFIFPSAQRHEAREHQSVLGPFLWLWDLWYCDRALQQGQLGGSAEQRGSASWLDVQVFPVNGSDSGKDRQNDLLLFNFPSCHVFLYLNVSHNLSSGN